jgi:transcriptional regulator with XRE-family HTH domain
MAFRLAYGRPMNFDGRAFGRRIASARVWLGLEPKEVALQLDLSAEAINRWERGGLQRAPKRGQVRLLAEVLQVPADWLLAGDTPPWARTGQETTARGLRDPVEAQHDDIISRLDQQDEVLRVLTALTNEIRSRLE